MIISSTVCTMFLLDAELWNRSFFFALARLTCAPASFQQLSLCWSWLTPCVSGCRTLVGWVALAPTLALFPCTVHSWQCRWWTPSIWTLYYSSKIFVISYQFYSWTFYGFCYFAIQYNSYSWMLCGLELFLLRTIYSVSSGVCVSLGILCYRSSAGKHWTNACFDHCCCAWSSACVTKMPWKP
jgi:hypothetical protein